MSEPRPACRHLALHALRNEEHDITLWGCDECQRRFYPACEQCVTIGHREGHGEHIEAAALPAAPAGLDEPLDRVLADLRNEVAKARAKHPPMHSPHEGHSVIREELDPELWDHVCADTGRSPEARHEALQVAAMGVRYILDLIDDPPAAAYAEGKPK